MHVVYVQTVLNVSSLQDGTLPLVSLLAFLHAAPQIICAGQESVLQSEPV